MDEVARLDKELPLGQVLDCVPSTRELMDARLSLRQGCIECQRCRRGSTGATNRVNCEIAVHDRRGHLITTGKRCDRLDQKESKCRHDRRRNRGSKTMPHEIL